MNNQEHTAEIAERYKAFEQSDDNYRVVQSEHIFPVLLDDGYGAKWAELAAYAKDDIPYLLNQLAESQKREKAAVEDIAKMAENGGGLCCICKHLNDGECRHGEEGCFDRRGPSEAGEEGK